MSSVKHCGPFNNRNALLCMGHRKSCHFSGSVVKFMVMQLHSPQAKGSFHINRKWFENFKKRISLYNVKRIGESASDDDGDGAK